MIRIKAAKARHDLFEKKLEELSEQGEVSDKVAFELADEIEAMSPESVMQELGYHGYELQADSEYETI